MLFKILKFTGSKIELYIIIKLKSQKYQNNYKIKPLNGNKKPNNKQ